jgi:hypothetical protein
VYEILGDPTVTGDMYSRAFAFDDAAKVGLQALAARTGAMQPADAYPCGKCTGENNGGLGRGFRAQVYGTVTALSTVPGVPHTIRVLDATASHNLAVGTACPDGAMFPAQNPAFGMTTTTTTTTTGGGSAPTYVTAPTPAATPTIATSPVTAPVVASPVAAPVATGSGGGGGAATPTAPGGGNSTTTDGA